MRADVTNVQLAAYVHTTMPSSMISRSGAHTAMPRTNVQQVMPTLMTGTMLLEVDAHTVLSEAAQA